MSRVRPSGRLNEVRPSPPPPQGGRRRPASDEDELDGRLQLLLLAEKVGNITAACKTLGYSRDSFYRFKTAYEAGGDDALRRLTRRKPLLKTRISPLVESRIVSLSIQHPSWGRQRVAKALRKEGHVVSGSGVRCVWLRHDLRQEASPKTPQAMTPEALPSPLNVAAHTQPLLGRTQAPPHAPDRQGLVFGRGRHLPSASADEMAVFRLETADLGGMTHVVATRAGLYAVSPTRYARLATGNFFGLSWEPHHLYCFQAFGNHLDNNGRLVDLRIEDSSIRSCRIGLTGIPNGCHQIDYVGDDLLMCDTYNSRIIQLNAAFDVKGEFFPTGHPRPKDYAAGYAHLNSIVSHRGRIFVMKHNGTGSSGRNSELAELDEEFRIVSTRILPGGDCHNIVFLEDGEPIFCDSLNGNIIDRRRVVTHIGAVFTRGLSVDVAGIAVGYSEYSKELDRVGVAGGVCFLDRRYTVRARLALPAAPTEIRRLDGLDYSLSNCPRADRKVKASQTRRMDGTSPTGIRPPAIDSDG